MGVCLAFDYKKHKNYASLLLRCELQRKNVLADTALRDAYLTDTRPAHTFQFSDLTPPNQAYMAGNYRGSQYPCLERSVVSVDGYFGSDPVDVEADMSDLHETLALAVGALQDQKDSASPKLTEVQYMDLLVALIAHFYVWLLRIHPYEDGNGHMARLLGYVICLKSGRRPKAWPLHKRSPFGNMVTAYREGATDKMEEGVLKAIRGR